MGWWDNLWGSSTSADDPLRKLDPKLREFLAKESPVKYNTPNSGPSAQAPENPAELAPSSADAGAAHETEASNEPLVPRESQFQDGRYAHLWKSYRPLAQIEAETKSDHEKLMDVLEGYKERKSQIGRAALENCALEQVDWRSCMTNPSWGERMTLCRDQVKKFERCYMTQTRLLKALGYLSSLDRTPELEEEIQMHADALYHRMLKQEAEIDAAKKEGRPIPKFTPIVTKPMVEAAMPDPELTPEQQEILKSKLEKVAEQDRAAEEEAIRGELRAKAEVAAKVQDLWRQQELDRQARKEKGEATLWDKVAGTFGNNNNNNNNNDGQDKK
ncbi:putative autophagy protein [Rosellinia necatrix]|uniref:Putative autophagy protein n=1 Tax=Rosellinia necatrix TaxID=77044 RepID=A0A1S7UMP6_ROSNE|nr:putative autophagy protein [Rosellinia necatrix]